MKFLGTIDEAKDIINKEFIDSLLGNYQPLITSTNKLSYSLISGVPTSLKNPYALTFGSKSYDGSGAITITASDLGALTSHQSIYNLTMQAGEFTAVTFAPNGAAKTVNIPTTTAHISEDGNLYFTNERAISALSETLSAYVSLNGTQEISGEKNFTGGLKVNSGLIHYDSTNGYWKLDGDLIVTGGISMYSSDTEFTPSTIMDALSVDNTNLKVVDGVLTFVGSTGGATTLGGLSNVDSSVDDGITGLLFNQNGTWISADNTTIRSYLGIVNTLGSLTNVGSWADSVASQDRIMYQAANSSQWVAKNLSDLAVGGVTGDYLPLSGGIISNTAYAPLTIHRDYGPYGTSIKFTNADDGVIGYIGVRGSGNADYPLNPIFENASGVYKIWHSGNDGSGSGLDADLLDGIESSKFYKEQGRFWSNYATSVLGNGSFYAQGYSPVSGAYAYGSILNFKVEDKITQFYITDGGQPKGTGGRMFFRDHWNASESITTRWIEVITSENIDSHNAGSATKLQTARTIWGQSFDGTGNVDGVIKINGLDVFYSNGTSTCHVSNDTVSTYVNGSNVYLRYNGNIGLILDSSGNVGIGTTSPAYKLDVSGTFRCTAEAYTNSHRVLGGNGGVWLYGGIRSGEALSIETIAADGTWLNRGITILQNGNVGINTITPSVKLSVVGDVNIEKPSTTNQASLSFMNTSSDLWQISGRFNKNNSAENDRLNFYYYNGTTWSNIVTLYNSGNMLVSGGITMYSDQRKKTILNHVELSLKEIADAPLIEHYYNSDEKKTTHVGSIAQYWAGLNDWFCKLDNEGYYTMEIQNAALASAISVARELVKFETETDRRIRLLEEENEQLKKEIEILKWNIA